VTGPAQHFLRVVFSELSASDPERCFRRLLAAAAAVRNFLAAKATTTREAREDARCAALAPFG